VDVADLQLSGCSASVDSNTALDLSQVDQVVQEIQSDTYKVRFPGICTG